MSKNKDWYRCMDMPSKPKNQSGFTKEELKQVDKMFFVTIVLPLAIVIIMFMIALVYFIINP